MSLKTYLQPLSSNFSKGAVGTALMSGIMWVLLWIWQLPFDYRKKNVNNDYETEDALRNQCTKYVIYGYSRWRNGREMDILLDRNMMKYHLCALKPLRTVVVLGGSKMALVGNPSSPSPLHLPRPFPVKYNSRSSKGSKVQKFKEYQERESKNRHRR